jgi:hypothetical protein
VFGLRGRGLGLRRHGLGLRGLLGRGLRGRGRGLRGLLRHGLGLRRHGLGRCLRGLLGPLRGRLIDNTRRADSVTADPNSVVVRGRHNEAHEVFLVGPLAEKRPSLR